MMKSLENTENPTKKALSMIHQEKTLTEWLTKLSVKDALATKKKNEDYHATFRVPLEEVIIQGEVSSWKLKIELELSCREKRIVEGELSNLDDWKYGIDSKNNFLWLFDEIILLFNIMILK